MLCTSKCDVREAEMRLVAICIQDKFADLMLVLLNIVKREFSGLDFLMINSSIEFKSIPFNQNKLNELKMLQWLYATSAGWFYHFALSKWPSLVNYNDTLSIVLAVIIKLKQDEDWVLQKS